jgi:hypothetical protein
MTKAELIKELEALSATLKGRDLSDASIERITKSVREIKRQVEGPSGYDPTLLRELRGLGKEYWRSIDVDKYIREERDSWDS